MKIEKCTAFQSFLDSNYNNVFDNFSSDSEYYNFLTRIAGDHVFECNTARIIDDGILSIVLNIDYFSAKKYTYICLRTNSKNYYYFVTGYKSLNDSDNPATQLYLKYDCFVNNGLHLAGLSSYKDDINFIERRHYEDCEIVNGVLQTNGYVSDEEPVENRAIPKGYEYLVLWAKIRFKIGIKDGAGVPIAYSLYKNEESTPYGIIPFRIVRKTGSYIEPVNGFTVTVTNKYDYGTGAYKSFSYTYNLDDSFVFSTEDVISVELTYNAPFIYDINLTSKTVTIYTMYTNTPQVRNVYPEEGKSIFAYNTCVGKKTLTITNINTGTIEVVNTPVPVIFCNHSSSTITNKTYKITKNMKVTDFLDDDKLISMDEEVNIANEARLYKYPYNYTSIVYNDSENILLTKPRYNQFNLFIDMTNPETRVNIYSDDRANTKNIIVKGNGEVVVYTDTLEYFIRNNGNAVLTNVLNSTVSSIAGIASAGAGITKYTQKKHNLTKKYLKATAKAKINESVDFGESLASTIAKVKDADNQSDLYNMPTIDAVNDLYQDLIYEKNYEFYDDNVKKDVYHDIHMYGENINRYESISINYHVTFDYVRTIDCSLPFILNEKERSEIENAYDRGITRWHYDPLNMNNSTYVDNFAIFNKKLINLSKIQFGGQ